MLYGMMAVLVNLRVHMLSISWEGITNSLLVNNFHQDVKCFGIILPQGMAKGKLME